MLDFFRGRLSAEKILDCLEHLPRTSAYKCAVAEDEDLAREVAADITSADDLPKPSKTPPMREWSPEVEALRDLQDVLDQTLRVLVKANGGKPGKHRPYPRPVTALSRAIRSARQKLRYERHRSLVDRVLRRD